MQPFDRLRANGVAGVEIAQKRPQIPPLQGEGDHEVVEGCHPIAGGHPSVWPTAINLALQGRMIGNDQKPVIQLRINLAQSRTK